MTQEVTAVEAPKTATQFSARIVPWMKLGKLTDQAITAAEAAKLGGLNFIVDKVELAYPDPVLGWDKRHAISDRRAIVRSDTGEWLGIMSKNYPLLQYGEAFDFMDGVSPEYVAAGALHGGRQGFMVVKAPETIKVLNGEDPHELFLVLRTSHDGSRAVEVSVMPLRSRCMNQLTLQSFSAGVPHRWAIKHTSSMHAKLQEAQESLQKLGAYAKKFEHNAQRLLKITITQADAEKLLQDTLPNRPKRDEQIESITTMWHSADTVGFAGTGWGLVNAVSEYFDWGRSGGSPQSRFTGALQGQTFKAINRVAARVLTRV